MRKIASKGEKTRQGLDFRMVTTICSFEGVAFQKKSQRVVHALEGGSKKTHFKGV